MSNRSLSAHVKVTPSTSTLSEELIIVGDVRSKGTLRLDGQVQGNIYCQSLLVSESSQLEGHVFAVEVVVHGRVIGSVQAQSVTLHSGCHVEGDLCYHGLTVEQGAYFNGISRCSISPSESIRAAPQQEPMTEDPERTRLECNDREINERARVLRLT
jgi:cytoskeletal protein CcmA (bactofilin family)